MMIKTSRFYFCHQNMSEINNNMNDKKDELNLHLQYLLSTVTNENPLEYYNDMYKSINPNLITIAKEEGKKLLQSEKKNGDKLCNVYFTLGGDSINRYLMDGIIATLLWLPLYIRDVADAFKLSREEVDTTLKVLNAISLPKISDATDETTAKTSSCRHYASFLIAIIRWLTTGVTMFKQTGEPRTNMEMVRFLTSTALNTFPAVPYCCYFIGQTKTNDMSKLAERFAKEIDLHEYMSTESFQINAPKFIVQTKDAPLVGISGHPLGELYVGMMDETTRKTEWFGVFVKNEQFEHMCTENGLSVNEVREYVMGVSKSQHEEILSDKNNKRYNIASFIEKQGNELIKTGFELFHKNDSKYYVTEDMIEKLT